MGLFGPVTVATRSLVAPPQRLALQTGTNQGRLQLGDRVSDGRYEDRWTLTGQKGDTIRVEVASRQFDTVARLEVADGRVLKEDDDSGDGTDARINTQLEEAGNYVVVVTSYATNAGGDYTVVLEKGSPASQTSSSRGQGETP